MWRNNEVRAFVDWLREHNPTLQPTQRVAFHGLDLYSLYNFDPGGRRNISMTSIPPPPVLHAHDTAA